jgi:hypothetical protein
MRNKVLVGNSEDTIGPALWKEARQEGHGFWALSWNDPIGVIEPGMDGPIPTMMMTTTTISLLSARSWHVQRGCSHWQGGLVIDLTCESDSDDGEVSWHRKASRRLHIKLTYSAG